MLSILKKIFSSARPQPDLIMSTRDINTYFVTELDNDPKISKLNYSIILAHLNHESKLSASLIQVEFEQDLENAEYIMKQLTKIYTKATIEKAWDDNFVKAFDVGVKYSILKSAGHNDHCEYCSSLFNTEIEIKPDTLSEFHKHCRCQPYKKSYMDPIINFDD